MADDGMLIRIVDAAMAEAARRGGARVACRAGCTPCCHGPFEISAVDAVRIQRGISELAAKDAAVVAELRSRAERWLPLEASGDADDEPCPALDSASGLCRIYEWRPLTCRTFGPPVRGASGAVAICELCYTEAGDEEIASAAVDLDPDTLESPLLAEAEAAAGVHGSVSVAWALARATLR